jgi:cytochrome c oxidase subunit 2
MPIAIRVVTDKEFTAWVADAKKKFASSDTDTYASAAAATQ